MIVCNQLTDEGEISALSKEWEELHTCMALSPFSSYAWAMAWWNHIGKPSGGTLMVVTCRDNGKLVGVVPFSIRRKGNVRILRLPDGVKDLGELGASDAGRETFFRLVDELELQEVQHAPAS